MHVLDQQRTRIFPRGRPSEKLSSMAHWRNGSQTTGQASANTEFFADGRTVLIAGGRCDRSTMVQGKATFSAMNLLSSGSISSGETMTMRRAVVPFCGRLSHTSTVNGGPPRLAA